MIFTLNLKKKELNNLKSENLNLLGVIEAYLKKTRKKTTKPFYFKLAQYCTLWIGK